MRIGIVGAGLAGLTAGRLLAQNGHEVIVLEKSRGYGGRLATRYFGDNKQIKLDHGSPLVAPDQADFATFIDELTAKNILKPWTDSFSFYNEEGMFDEHPSREKKMVYMAPNGMNKIGEYMSRWVDVRLNTKVSGITMVAPGARKKRPWILNMANISVLETDALIIALPAVQAAGLLQTAQDETPVRSLHMKVSAVQYDPGFTLMAGFGAHETPDWKGIACQHPVLGFISNESSKRDNKELTLVVHANKSFSTGHRNTDKDLVRREMITALGQVLGDWAAMPEWSDIHFWRYAFPSRNIDAPFLESTQQQAPLAIIGDYFQGNSMQAAYVSGKKLAEHWLTQFANR